MPVSIGDRKNSFTWRQLVGPISRKHAITNP